MYLRLLEIRIAIQVGLQEDYGPRWSLGSACLRAVAGLTHVGVGAAPPPEALKLSTKPG